MVSLRLSAIALAVCFCSSVAAQESHVHQFCAMQWASDEPKRDQCVRRQIEGAQSIARYLDWAKASAGPDGQHVTGVFELCRQKWAPDYYLVDNCLRARAMIRPPE